MFFNYKLQDVNYEIIGDKGKDLVLLHGWGVNSQTFDKLVEGLKSHYRIINIDLIGFGMSDEPINAFSLDDYVDMLHSLLNHLKIKKPIILGHSFGGRIAIRYSNQYLVESLILVSAAGIKHSSIKTKYKIYRYKFLKFIYKIFNKKKLLNLLKTSGSDDYKNASNVMKKTMSNIINIDLKNEIKSINCNTLLLWGYKDNITPLSDGIYMNNNIVNSKLIIFYNSGHFPYLEEESKFIKSILNGGL